MSEEKLDITLEETENERAMSDIDRRFLRIQKATMLARVINATEMKIVLMCRSIRNFFPDSDVEDTKVIMSRIEDINDDKVEELSSGFIHELLTIDGKERKMIMPDTMVQTLGFNPLEVSGLDGQRAMIGSLKALSSQVNDVHAHLTKLRETFSTQVSEEDKLIIASPDELEKFTMDFYKAKLEDDSTPDDFRKSIEETIKWTNYAYTLDPIKAVVEQIIKVKGTTKSICYGFNNRADKVVESAKKICTELGITYPFSIIQGAEDKLLGKEYEKHKHLFGYLLSWYIKYRGRDLDRYEKIFVTQVITIITQIVQHINDPKESNPTNDIRSKFLPGYKELIDLVVVNNR